MICPRTTEPSRRRIVSATTAAGARSASATAKAAAADLLNLIDPSGYSGACAACGRLAECARAWQAWEWPRLNEMTNRPPPVAREIAARPANRHLDAGQFSVFGFQFSVFSQ